MPLFFVLLILKIERIEEGDLMSYIVCEKRKGSQKVHVEVCQKKCKLVQECKSFKEFISNLEKKAA